MPHKCPFGNKNILRVIVMKYQCLQLDLDVVLKWMGTKGCLEGRTYTDGSKTPSLAVKMVTWFVENGIKHTVCWSQFDHCSTHTIHSQLSKFGSSESFYPALTSMHDKRWILLCNSNLFFYCMFFLFCFLERHLHTSATQSDMFFL